MTFDRWLLMDGVGFSACADLYPVNPMLPPYAELHCRSSFTFLTGASRPEELVQAAQQRGYAALAITDECSLSGVVRAHEEALACGLPLIIGAQMALSPSPEGDGAVLAGHHAAPVLLLLAMQLGIGREHGVHGVEVGAGREANAIHQ